MKKKSIFENYYKMNKMKIFTKFLIIGTSVILFVSCGTGKKIAEAKPTVVPLSDTVSITEGSIVYGLPRTVFTVKFDLERTIEIPGPYTRYAADLLGITDAVDKESEFWTITGVIVNTHEELDPSEYYVVKSSSFLKSNALSLRKEGLILDINPRQFLTSEKQSVSDGDFTDQLRFADLGSDEYFSMQSDTAYKRVSIDSTFIRIPYIVEKKKRLSTDQLAEKAAKRIMEIRDGKHLILTGEANVFPQSEAPINEINRLEKEYLELFTGKVIKEKRSYTVTLIPEQGMEKKALPLFQFSELTGPSSQTAKNGNAVTAEIIPELKTKALTIVDKNQVVQPGVDFDKLYYRIPDIVNVKISLGKEVLFSSRKMVYQFGETIQLPANFIIGK
jgi:hypothetical protein